MAHGETNTKKISVCFIFKTECIEFAVHYYYYYYYYYYYLQGSIKEQMLFPFL